MITFLHGRLIEALPTQAIVDVHGVGYEVLIPLSSFDRFPSSGEDIHLLTHLVVREDAHTLYGFITAAERELFRLLINTVSGIGPRIALNILSGMPPNAFRHAVVHGDVRALSQIHGLGKKTAERIIVELKDKLGSVAGWEPARPGAAPLPAGEQSQHDAILALCALGFKQPEALETVRSAQALLGTGASVDQLVRAALKKGGG